MTHPTSFVSPDHLRANFAAAMSDMYQREVPLYGQLLALVTDINRETLAKGTDANFDVVRISGERHGAIRVGTAAELRLIARAFAVLGMEPVAYYDLAPAGLPVHSTAFRPINAEGLSISPFRVFTSLLRLDLIEPTSLRATARQALAKRQIVTPTALALIGKAEAQGGLDAEDGTTFVQALLDTFRWHAEASVDAALYAELTASHRLIADIVSFRGPHINHLTPRVLDIDAAQTRMMHDGFDPKEAIEGPPQRRCPVLLRQTSFKALAEPIRFPSGAGANEAGVHVARFGEIEQRGAALTREGRARYDAWIAKGGHLCEALPDDWRALHREKLAYFRYRMMDNAKGASGASVQQLIDDGVLAIEPVLYEDFLPVSAAGIFRSNLAADDVESITAGSGDRAALEAALGRPILDEFALYSAEAERSLAACAGQLGIAFRSDT